MTKAELVNKLAEKEPDITKRRAEIIVNVILAAL